MMHEMPKLILELHNRHQHADFGGHIVIRVVEKRFNIVLVSQKYGAFLLSF
jgi:hypothetical protein